MFKVIWDKETRGVLLTDDADGKDIISPPRPVYYEELDLLGLYRYWDYPKTEAPVLWAIDRRYFYNGDLVAQVKGGNILEDPEVEVMDCSYDLKLTSVDIDLMMKKNKQSLFILENEGIDFVKNVFSKHRNDVDSFVVAFSGGKDSQVVLDIVSRVLPPDEYIVVFTDTDMELPQTYEIIAHTKRQYESMYPSLQFKTAKHEQSALELWRKFGPPSRMHRWCCFVMKTSLFIRNMKKYLDKDRQIKAVVFEGVRADESSNRRQYSRIGSGVRHTNLINSRIILDWNTTEVFLYMIFRNIKMNNGYRLGLNRIGCGICPFASSWSEYIIEKNFPNLTKKYLEVIRGMAINMGVKKDDRINEYIKKGNWKKKSGGRGLDIDGSRLDVIKREPCFEAVLSEPKQNVTEWLKVLGTINYRNYTNKVLGELKFGGDVHRFEINYLEGISKISFKLSNTYRKFELQRKLVRTLNKAVFCESCGACEAECPSGALTVIPDLYINPKSCTNCHKCITFCEKGCLAAKTRKISEGGNKMKKKTSGIDRYSTFGIRQHWMISFFTELDNWLSSNNGLGPRQITAMINWLREAELLDNKDKIVTELSKILSKVFFGNEELAWEIIWINLYFNSKIVNWYVNNIEFNMTYPQPEILEMLVNDFPDLSENTLQNPLRAIFNMFERSPVLGDKLKLGIVSKQGRVRSVTKIGRDGANIVTIAYFLYKIANLKGIYEFTVSDFYGGNIIGPYEILGTSRQKFENSLRVLQENPNGLVGVDLTAGLDNIHLREDLGCVDMIEILL